MKVVLIASEAVPFSKTGGLADVAGALPRALAALGHEVTLISPRYRQVLPGAPILEATGLSIRVPIGSKAVGGRLLAAEIPGGVGVVIDQPSYFDRDGLYGIDGKDYLDNSERFAFFARGAIEAVKAMGLRPDVLHLHDWQTGPIPGFLRGPYRDDPSLRGCGTVLTIHNLAYQGVFPREHVALTGLADSPRIVSDGRLNFLKAGIAFADLLTTVSPTYAKEVQTPAFGCGLDGLLRERSADLRGLLNGIDTTLWNPADDVQLACRFDAETFEAGKAGCKALLQRRLGLPERPEVPLFAQIGRLDPQKGWELLAGVTDDLLAQDVQLVVLGQGLPVYHELLDRLSNRHSGRLRAVLEFAPSLAHQIEAGADFLLMPSLYEPCGLNQLYSLRYGTVPIVRATGGLADTVVDATPVTLRDGSATGFAFREASPDPFWQAILRALTLWRDRPSFRRLVRAGMAGDWSWDRSARSYTRVYEEARDRASA